MPDSFTEADLDALLDTVGSRYRAKFGTYPPIAMVYTPPDLLDKLMREALERGVALTADDLAKAQGGTAPPLSTNILI